MDFGFGFLRIRIKLVFLDIGRLIIYQSTSDTNVDSVTILHNCNYALFFDYGIYLTNIELKENLLKKYRSCTCSNCILNCRRLKSQKPPIPLRGEH